MKIKNSLNELPLDEALYWEEKLGKNESFEDSICSLTLAEFNSSHSDKSPTQSSTAIAKKLNITITPSNGSASVSDVKAGTVPAQSHLLHVPVDGKQKQSAVATRPVVKLR